MINLRFRNPESEGRCGNQEGDGKKTKTFYAHSRVGLLDAKSSMPIDKLTWRESSEDDLIVNRIDTENRDSLIHGYWAYGDSDDTDVEKKWDKGHFITLRKWEGVVEAVLESSFVARIKDVANEVPDERVEIDFDELTNVDEKRLIKIGAIFSWTMGYRVSPGGTRKRQAVLIFRIMPRWTEDDIQRGCKVADEIYERLNNSMRE